MIVACDMSTGIELTAYYIPNYLEISQWNKPALILLYPVFDLRRLSSLYDTKIDPVRIEQQAIHFPLSCFWTIFVLPQIEMFSIIVPKQSYMKTIPPNIAELNQRILIKDCLQS